MRLFITILNILCIAAICFAQPMTPKLVAAQAGNATVKIQWRYDGGGSVDDFLIKRSEKSGGPYETVVTGMTSPLSDLTVKNDTKYYYVVVATKGGVESLPSQEMWAVPRNQYNIIVNCKNPLGELPRYEKYHTASSPMSSATIADLMQYIGVKLVRNMASTLTWTASPTAAYNDVILGLGAMAMMCIYRPTDKNMVYQTLKALKYRYPDYEYVEVDNEPDIEHSDFSKYYTVGTYMKRYRAVVEGIKMFHNDPAFKNTAILKIGGPTVAGCQANKGSTFGTSTFYPFEQGYVEEFLDSIKAGNLPLDFVSWHSYMMHPAELKRQGEVIKQKLNSIGKPDAKTVVSEWSGEKGGTGTLNPKASEVVAVASYQAAGYYYWMEGSVDMPMTWAVVNEGNHLKSEFVPKIDGKVYPLYNMHEAYYKMRKTRIECKSDGLSSEGYGVGGVASSDNGGVSIFLWNHKSPVSVTSTNVTLANVSYSGKAMLKVYLIDEMVSNYVADPMKDRLQLIVDKEVEIRDGRYEYKLDFRQYAVVLLDIEYNQTTSASILKDHDKEISEDCVLFNLQGAFVSRVNSMDDLDSLQLIDGVYFLKRPEKQSLKIIRTNKLTLISK
jgi:hypothetical protein